MGKTKCGGESGASANGMMQGGEQGAQEKMVKYACVAAPSLKARTLKKRAMKGESLGIELAPMATEYAKMESEPMPCGAYGSSGRMGGEKGVESGMNLTSAAAVSILSLNTLPVATNLKCQVWVVHLVLVQAPAKDLLPLNGNVSSNYQQF